MNDPPLIFFAFANASDNSPDDYLPNLKIEERGILDHFTPLKYHNQSVNFEHREQVQAVDFFDILRIVGEKITIMHYSGHADSMSLDLDDGEYSIDRLCTAIANRKNIKLVFLNGCSTGGMVKKLLDKDVDAVIATSQKVGDNKACNFSIDFYKAFAIKGKELQTAFKEAVSNLKGGVIKEEDAIRGIRSRDPFPEKDIPWALYHKKDNEPILKWKLIVREGKQFTNSSVQKKVRDIENKIQLKRTALKKAEEKLNKFKSWLSNDNDSKTIEGLNVEIKEHQEKLNENENALDILYGELKSINRQQDQEEVKKHLTKALFSLNYTSQKLFFREKFEENRIGAYFLLGSPQCGQDILMDRLLHSAGMKSTAFDNEIPHFIPFDFSGHSNPNITKNNIWSILKEQMPELEASDQNQLVKEVYAKYFKQKSIVFIFNNIHAASPDTLKTIICDFWLSFLQSFLPLVDNNLNQENKLLLLVIDKNVCFKNINGTLKSDKEEFLVKFFSEKRFKEYPSYPLPTITPLEVSALNNWIVNNDLPIDLFSNDQVVQMAHENQGYILPTIKGLCKIAEMNDIYEEQFRKFEYKINDQNEENL